MKLKPQITVFLENQPGIMAKICKLIKNARINIDAFTIFGTVDHGVFRLIVDQPVKTLALLSEGGFLAIESKVIEVPLENTPGGLHKISEILSKGKVNIEYAYGSTNIGAERQRFFLQASDNFKAVRLLAKVLEGKTGKPVRK